MRCKVCSGPALIEIRRHNANFCQDHFIDYCHRQLGRAIKDHSMLQPEDRVLVAVSGGKDSLAVWDMLQTMGYEADGLYIGLGIGDYSDASGEVTRQFAAERGLKLNEIDLRRDYDFDVPTAAQVTKRVPCSACGLSKRHLFDSAAVDGGYDVVVTGHNLDDEAAVLYGNVLRWEIDYLGRQHPALPARAGFPRKVKPLVRLTERETAAYCIMRGIDYLVEECPMAAGNKHIGFKESLNALELESPGIKTAFYHGFLTKAAERFSPGDSSIGNETGEPVECERCGSPSAKGVCAFCHLSERLVGADPVPVELVRTRR